MGSIERTERGRRKLDFHLSVKQQRRGGPGEDTLSPGLGQELHFLEKVGLSWPFHQWGTGNGGFENLMNVPAYHNSLNTRMQNTISKGTCSQGQHSYSGSPKILLLRAFGV